MEANVLDPTGCTCGFSSLLRGCVSENSKSTKSNKVHSVFSTYTYLYIHDNIYNGCIVLFLFIFKGL